MLIAALTPLIAYITFGALLRVAGVVSADLAPTLFRFVFVCTLPPLVFASIVGAPLDAESGLLPLTGFLINITCALAAWCWGRWRGLDRRDTGLLIFNASIINMLFTYPFVQAIVGDDGLRDAALFDIGNATYVATIASVMATRFGREGDAGIGSSLAELLRLPIFYGLAAALVVNLSGITLPPLVLDVAWPIGRASTPIILVALGISLTPAAFSGGLPVVPILFRMGLGFVLGVLLTAAFGIDGQTRWIVLAGAAAPIGFGAVTLAAVGRLDVEKAAAAVSVSVTLGIVTSTALLVVGRSLVGS